MQQWFENLRNMADLQAQLEMARWAFWMVVLTVVSCVVAAGGLVALLASLRQTRTAIKNNMVSEADARRLGEANARAYLHAEHFEFSADGLAGIVTIKNTGSTPATMVCAGSEAKSVSPGNVKAAAVFSSYDYKVWPSLPAGESQKFRVDFTSGSDIVQDHKRALAGLAGLMPQSTQSAQLIVVVGRIVWRDVFGQFLETGFVFYTTDVVRDKVKVPNAILPAFRLIEMSEVPKDLAPEQNSVSAF